MNVFISYSRRDYEWVTKIRTYLQPLVNAKEIKILSDMNILPGQDWNEQIKKFIELADIAIVLISSSYVASNFLCEFELSSILKAAQENRTQVILILIQSTHLEAIALRKRLNEQNLNYDFLNLSQPLASLTENNQDFYLKKLLQLVKEIANITNKKKNTKESYLQNNIGSVQRNIDPHNIFYGSGENIFIQAERELERNK